MRGVFSPREHKRHKESQGPCAILCPLCSCGKITTAQFSHLLISEFAKGEVSGVSGLFSPREHEGHKIAQDSCDSSWPSCSCGKITTAQFSHLLIQDGSHPRQRLPLNILKQRTASGRYIRNFIRKMKLANRRSRISTADETECSG